MFRHFITSLNVEKLIKMQANQESFAPGVNFGKQMRAENRRNVSKTKPVMAKKCKALVKTYGKSKFSKNMFEE